MKLFDDGIRLSSRDLTGHVNCSHLTQLELQVARGGAMRHEREFIQVLADQGLRIAMIDGVDVDDGAVERTLAAMRNGADVIVQAALRDGDWIGRADVRLRARPRRRRT